MSIDRELLHTALLAAYPDYSELARLLDFGCDGLQLSYIVPSTAGQADVVYAVIRDAEAKGWLNTLVVAAAKRRPNNAELAALAAVAKMAVPSVLVASVPTPPAGVHISGGQGVVVGNNNQQFNFFGNTSPGSNMPATTAGVRPSGLSQDLYDRLRALLQDCDQFSSNRDLRNVFATDELRPWRNGIPEGDNLNARVDGTIAYLTGKNHANGDSALALLLGRLASLFDAADQRHGRLIAMEREVTGALVGCQ